MRTLPLLALVACFALVGCGDEDPKPADAPPVQREFKPFDVPVAGGTNLPKGIDQSSPSALAESIFAAARSGDLASLQGIADPVDADGDSKNVANASSAPANQQDEFKLFFATGKINGEVKVVGDAAEVPILFGPDGKKPETFKMVKRDGKWYLQSF
jgi:hypothetical protein